MILTLEQIEREVSSTKGTWVKRRNLKKRLVEESNREVNARIDKIKSEIRGLKAEGVQDWFLSPAYAKVTELEMRLIQ